MHLEKPSQFLRWSECDVNESSTRQFLRPKQDALICGHSPLAKIMGAPLNSYKSDKNSMAVTNN